MPGDRAPSGRYSVSFSELSKIGLPDTVLTLCFCRTHVRHRTSSGPWATEGPLPALALSGQWGPCTGSHPWGFRPWFCPQSTALEDSRGGNGCSLSCVPFSRHHHSLSYHHHHYHCHPVVTPLHRLHHTYQASSRRRPCLIRPCLILRELSSHSSQYQQASPVNVPCFLWIWCYLGLPSWC